MQFTITPNSGYQFTVTSIVVQWQRSGTGNTAIALRSSVDGYATDLDAVKNVTDNTSTRTFTWTFSQANSSSAVTYRFYSYAEGAAGSGGPGDGTGNDIVVNGTVTATGGTAPTVTSQAATLIGYNPTTSIEYVLLAAGPVRLEIYNVLGERIATVVDEVQEAGFYTGQWNGRDGNNNPAASGMYLYKISAGQFTSVKKMMLLK